MLFRKRDEEVIIPNQNAIWHVLPNCMSNNERYDEVHTSTNYNIPVVAYDSFILFDQPEWTTGCFC